MQNHRLRFKQQKEGLENLVLKEEMKRTRYKSCAVKRSDESVYAC